MDDLNNIDVERIARLLTDTPDPNGTCNHCGKKLELGDWPYCPHGSVFSVNAARFDPSVVYRNAAGEYSFPTSPDAAYKPAPEGFEKVELTKAHEIRKFENTVNSQERKKWDEHQERLARASEESARARRADLRAAMQHMTPFGRDFARAAMDANDRKGRGSFDAGFRVSAFSDDASNREPYRDERTGWRSQRS